MFPNLDAQAEIQVDKDAEKKAKAAERKEKKRLENEERSKFLKKEHLRREIEFGARNFKRLQKSWREMMIRIKMPDIREDLEIASRTFDRVLDTKDHSISLLLDAINDAEEQYQMNERAHMEHIDRFIEFYKMKLTFADDNYHVDLDKLLTESENETSAINSQSAEDDIFLQAMILTTKQRLEESLNNVKSVTFTKIESQTEDFKNLRRMEMSFMKKNIKQLWKELQINISDYMRRTKSRRKEYEILREKDCTERNIIDGQVTRTATLFEEIRKLKEKIANFKSTADQQNANIVKERNLFQKAYWTTKNRFLEEQAADKNQITIMTREYNQTIDLLNQLVKKLENILTLMQICRKYETQEEKVVPFSFPLEVNPTEISTSLNWTQSAEVMKEIQYLENFWRRSAGVEIILTELKQEQIELKNERSYLRQCLKNYISERCEKFELSSERIQEQI